MSYYDDEENYSARGIDYDLAGCLEYNSQDNFDLDDIKKVLAVVEGANDESDWHWILELDSGEYYYLRGGCDYTGWDCQSWASSVKINGMADLQKIIKDGLLPVTEENSPYKAGLGHMLQILSGTFGENDIDVLESLARQLADSKDLTWRE